jgi:Protein of unknown function (DUF1579)
LETHQKPAPELRKLDYFVGTWITQGNVHPGPFVPVGKMTMTEHNTWMAGGFFLVLHSQFTSDSLGSGSGTAFMGYDIRGKVYTYDEFNSMGAAQHSVGTVDGDIWTWTGEEHHAGNILKTRVTMKIISPTSYTVTFEVSQDGSHWAAVVDGKAAKEE